MPTRTSSLSLAVTMCVALAVGAAVFALISKPAAASATGTSVLPLRALGEAANDFPRGEACLSRIAVNITFGHVCSDVCVTNAQCPTGWGCKVITQGNGTDVGICFPRRVRDP